MRAEETLKRSVYSLGAVLVAVMGIGFLATAIWLLLAEWRGAVFACLIVGLLLLGGALIFALAARRKRLKIPSTVQPVAPVMAPMTMSSASALAPVMIQAFLTGLTLGLSGKGKQDDDD